MLSNLNPEYHVPLKPPRLKAACEWPASDMVSFYGEVVPFAALVMVECTNVGLSVLYKAASLQGLSFYVFVFYSSSVATFILFLCFPLFNKNVALPPNAFRLFLRISHLGLTGYLLLLCSYAGIAYSPATLSAALGNLVPALTFILAITFRMEKPAWKSQSTLAKIIGTAVSIAGACAVTFYQGPTLIPWPITNPSLPHQAAPLPSSWVLGGFLLGTEFLLLSIWYIFQTQAVKIYPAEIRLVFFSYLCVAIISSIVALVVERNTSAWQLGFDIKLAAVIYAGVLSKTVGTVIHTWALRVKGPVYVAMFRPLSIAIAVIMSGIFLGESLHLGSVIGSVVISVGFYSVVWGKAKEERGKEEMSLCKEGTVPLLQNT